MSEKSEKSSSQTPRPDETRVWFGLTNSPNPKITFAYFSLLSQKSKTTRKYTHLWSWNYWLLASFVKKKWLKSSIHFYQLTIEYLTVCALADTELALKHYFV